MIVLAGIVAIAIANYMFLNRDKRRMHNEERRNERRDRLMESLRNRAAKDGKTDQQQTPEGDKNQ